MTTKILYLPAARLTFDVDLAKKMFAESKTALSQLDNVDVIAPDELLSDPGKLSDFIKQQDTSFDLVVFQSITFVDGEFIKNTIDLVKAPVIVWGLREPSIGGRLRLNTLTGVMAAANTLMFNHRRYLYLIGNPEDEQTIKELKQKVGVMTLINRLHNTHIGVVGKYPSGFYFSDTDNQALHDALGVSIDNYELKDWFDESRDVTEEEYTPELAYAEKNVVGLNKTDETVKRFAQFTTVAKRHIKADHLNSIAMRCWPDFFEQLHAAPCGVFSQLTNQGIPTSCECDIHGSLSMYILQELSNGNAPYLGDVVNFIPEENAIVMWHCGFAPFSLANQRTGAKAGIHPNRKIGLAMDFGLKPGQVTLFRVGYTPEGYRFVTTRGEVLDKDNSYMGTSAQIKLQTNVDDFIKQSVDEGYEPHFALVYGDYTSQIADMGRVLGVKTEII
ncbi:hypothetical protein [Lacticaseibacillus sp. GG6-2]